MEYIIILLKVLFYIVIAVYIVYNTIILIKLSQLKVSLVEAEELNNIIKFDTLKKQRKTVNFILLYEIIVISLFLYLLS